VDYSLVRRAARSLENATMALLPHGGQGAARRNAWSSMAHDVTRSRARRDADLAMDRAVSRARQQDAATS
jgi:hypothetical protein